MLELIKRTKVIFIICIAVIVLFNYFVIFRLMKLELEDSVTAYFIELANSRHMAIENAVNTGINGAKSLSSRTMIKEKLIEYFESAMSLEELKAFTQPKYVDGALVLDNIVAAIRIAGGNVIADYENPDYNFTVDTLDLSFDLYAKIDTAGGNYYLVVDSPVKDSDALLAVDRVVLDMSGSISSLNDAQNNIAILNDQEAADAISAAEIIIKGDNYVLCRGNENYTLFKQLLESSWVVITTPRTELMKPINQLTVKMLIATAVMFLGLLAMFYIAIIRFANKLLETAEKSRTKFENLAYRDELTGAYSRIFLDFWRENLLQKDHQYCIIMIDLDELKDINDELGHLMGDEVLKEVAKAVTRTIRTGDIFIRFGGDEFLIILENVKENTGGDIMKRVEAKLNEDHGMDFDISISYGVYAMNNEEDFNDAILMADRRMYMTKKMKKEKIS